jgi:hypothetical protein
MKSAKLGKRTSGVEITNVSKHGFWLLIADRELFVAFEQFPWFRDAAIGQLLNVELPSAHHLHWPDLDVDIAVDSIDHPEHFPLVSKVRSNLATQRTRRAPASPRKRRAAARR